MRILLIDNYDSFVYNIVGMLQQCRDTSSFDDLEWDVIRNDLLPYDGLDYYDALILSPGPGIPSEAGEMMRIINQCAETHPILGICLGCQAIAEYFGASLCQLSKPLHGHCSELQHIDPDDKLIGEFTGGRWRVGRYHSWMIDRQSIPKGGALLITSCDENENIMSVRHRHLPIFGTQFHPESIITENGIRIIYNFLNLVRGGCRESLGCQQYGAGVYERVMSRED